MERTLLILGIAIPSCPRAPHGDMPGNNQPLGQRDRAEEDEADRSQEENAGEGELRPHVAGGDLDIETEALIRSDELGDGGADSSVETGVFESHEALRHRRRQPDLEEGPPSAGAGRKAEAGELLAPRLASQGRIEEA